MMFIMILMNVLEQINENNKERRKIDRFELDLASWMFLATTMEHHMELTIE